VHVPLLLVCLLFFCRSLPCYCWVFVCLLATVCLPARVHPCLFADSNSGHDSDQTHRQGYRLYAMLPFLCVLALTIAFVRPRAEPASPLPTSCLSGTQRATDGSGPRYRATTSELAGVRLPLWRRGCHVGSLLATGGLVARSLPLINPHAH